MYYRNYLIGWTIRENREEYGVYFYMKRVFIYGRATRIISLIAFSYFAYLLIRDCVRNEFQTKQLILLLVYLVFSVAVIIQMYTVGIFINRKTNTLRIVLGLSKENCQLLLYLVKSVDVERVKKIGMDFIINYRDGSSKRIRYLFYRLTWLESLQFNRIKRQLYKMWHE